MFSNRYAFAALKADKTVVTWGSPTFGGDSSLVEVELKDVANIFSTDKAFAALKGGGAVVTWGSPEHGGDSSRVSAQLDGGTAVVQIAGTSGTFAALRADNTVVVWGGAEANVDSGGTSSPTYAAVQTALETDGNINRIWANDFAFAATLYGGSAIVWGDANKGGAFGAGMKEQMNDLVKDIYPSSTAFAVVKAVTTTTTTVSTTTTTTVSTTTTTASTTTTTTVSTTTTTISTTTTTVTTVTTATTTTTVTTDTTATATTKTTTSKTATSKTTSTRTSTSKTATATTATTTTATTTTITLTTTTSTHMCDIDPDEALFNQTCCALDSRSFLTYGSACTPDFPDSPCAQNAVCDGTRPYCLSLEGTACNGTGTPNYPTGECDAVGKCVYVPPKLETNASFLVAIAAVCGTAGFILILIVVLQCWCKAHRPKPPFDGSRANEPGPEDLKQAVRAAYLRGAKKALLAEREGAESAEFIAKQEELLAVQADLFAAQFMGDFEPHVFADAELSPHWSRTPSGGFEFALNLEDDGQHKGRKMTKGESELEAAIRAAFASGKSRDDSFKTAGNIPYSVVLLMGAEVVYPRACTTKDETALLEIDSDNHIYEVHEGPDGTEKDLIQKIDTEGEDSLVQDPDYIHVMCPAKLGFEIAVLGDETSTPTQVQYKAMLAEDLGESVQVLRVTAMPTTLVCYGPSACAIAAQRLHRSGIWNVNKAVVTTFKLVSPMGILDAAQRGGCPEKVSPIITYDVVRVKKLAVLEAEIQKTAAAVEAAEDARQMCAVPLSGIRQSKAAEMRRMSAGNAESALKAAFSDFTRHEVARIRAQMESSMHLDAKLRQRLAAKLAMVEKELDATEALAAAVEDGKTEDDFSGAMRQAFIDHKKAMLATGRSQSERQATTAALLRARMANKLSGIDAELRASSKPDLHLFEGMDQLQAAASQLRVAMGKVVDIGDRTAVQHNQAEKVSMVEHFLVVLPDIKKYLEPLVKAQGALGAPPPPDTQISVVSE